MSTEVKSLSVYDRMADPLSAIRELGHAIAHSQMFGCANEEQGRVLAMACFAKRMDPLALAERYHLIQGHLSMRADAMLAGLHERGGSHRVIRRDSEGAEIEISCGNDTQRFSLTWQQAQEEPFVWRPKQPGKLKDNWATPRSRMQMLWARVVSDGVRTMCPEVVAGIYAPEELGDDAAAVDVPWEPVQPIATHAVQTPSQTAPQQQPPPATAADGFATADQVQKIIDMYVELQVSHEAQEAALAKRGVKSLRSLTEAQADELIAKLWAKRPATSELCNDPCRPDQIERVKELIRQIAQQGPTDIADRIKQKLQSHGLQKIAELTVTECDRLLAALGVENLEAFFESSLAGHAASMAKAKN